MNFDTVLVANRGEIACRVIRSARELGLRTVAVYSDADVAAAHVEIADTAVRLGEGSPADSYLRGEKVIAAALATGAGAIHPGYGFLSENATFAEDVAAAGIAFVGPTPEQLRVFGDKHTAREAARAAGVPLVAGSGLLESADHAVEEARRIGLPVMLKAVGGGGGIGMRACSTEDEVREAFERVVRLAAANFSSTGVFVERFVAHARHIEVQVFGDGAGRVVSLGTRDCSLQRRNQKVIEEAPAPGLSPELTEQLLSSSRDLARSVNYRSAGTVEFVYDTDRGEASFLEVNTRLQVEHPITEAVTRVDLVAWMLKLAGGESDVLSGIADSGPEIQGHAVEARVYAEDPGQDYRPSSGILTEVRFPDDVRVDTWVETGSEVSPFYDPMIAKVITHSDSRDSAFQALAQALEQTSLHGVHTNLAQLRAIARDPVVSKIQQTTATLATLPVADPRVDVERGGTMTTLQDLPGRIGLWNVGVPPSGPMDDLSFTLANTAVGNPQSAPALECTVQGPRLRFSERTLLCVTGAPVPVTINGEPAAMWQPLTIPAGAVVDIGAPLDAGIRSYVAVAGGFHAPSYHGSSSTFTLGGFGGTTGRALATGDVLHLAHHDTQSPRDIDSSERPEMVHDWILGALEGPQTAPAYFIDDDMRQLFRETWRVSSHANRTGIRLEGPAPQWSRTDGGEAGLHPSNLHDNPYSVGALNVSGDTPILLGPDGPSLGGFVCPLTVASAHRWKLGQLRPGDTVTFVLLADETADHLRGSSQRSRNTLPPPPLWPSDRGVLGTRDEGEDRPSVAYLRGGDDNVLVEYGDMVLDLGLRMRAHALSQALTTVAHSGIIDITPGVRSLHVHFDPSQISQRQLIELLTELEKELPQDTELSVPSREIRLPMSFDDPSIAEAIDRYQAGVRDKAPWLPSNIEFIRRINGLNSVDEVRDIVFSAEYLVLGLGDVYLGAPLAVPLDPRHRLVTTKYNPARTWTPSDTVGIGGKYLCVYGMASPGGYQLVGRTIPIWSGYRQRTPFEAGKPWLFRFFDRIRWEPVSAEELLEQREAMRAGRLEIDIRDGVFTLAEHRRMLRDNAQSIAEFETHQNAAFDAEKIAWRKAGEFDQRTHDSVSVSDEYQLGDLSSTDTLVAAPMSGHVWRIDIAVGQRVHEGDVIAVLEAMKLELPVTAPCDGIVRDILAKPGSSVSPGNPLVVIGEDQA